MLQEIHIQRYADVLVWGLKTARRSTGGEFKKGDIVTINFELGSLCLAEEIYHRLVLEGIHPSLKFLSTPKMELSYYTHADEKMLGALLPWTKTTYRNLHGTISLRAPSSLTHLKDIDPKKRQISALSGKPLKKIIDWREANGHYGWTLCAMPTEILASQAGLSLEEYEEEIIRACYLDKENPVEIWDGLRAESLEIRKWLEGLKIKNLLIESENIYLNVILGVGRKWLGVSGHNIPSFEIFTSPDWRGTNGTYFANTQSFHKGNLVKGVYLVFKNGSVVESSAEEGEKFLQGELAIDRGANKLGEFSLTDKRFSPISKFMADTLYDENVGQPNGNCHIAVGNSFPDTYVEPKNLTAGLKKKLGFNVSVHHWDLINTEEKRVTATLAGGKKIVIYENGMFKR